MAEMQGAGLTRVDGGWLAVSYPAVRAVLEDVRLEVAEVPPSAAVGTVSWLRAEVSRFTNGERHDQRRARVVELLRGLEPARLRDDARRRALAAPDTSRAVDETSRLAHHVPVATLAAALGAQDPDRTADAVIDCAAGYFPHSGAAAVARADLATASLIQLLADPDQDLVVARIAVLVQACDATAALIAAALQLLPDAAPDRGTDAVLWEAARVTPPVRVMRRVAAADAVVAGRQIARGDAVACDTVQAGGSVPDVLTFGLGPRACPGVAQALALAAGVVDAIRGTTQ